MAPAKKRSASSPPVTDDQMRDMRNEMNEMNNKQTELAEMIKELHQQATEPKKESYIDKFPIKWKEFSMKHTLNNVSKILGEADDVSSEERNFHGMNWHFGLYEKKEGVIGCFLHCSNAKLQNPWMVETEFTFLRSGKPTEWHENLCNHTFTNTDNGYGIMNFMTREELLSAVNDEVTIEVEVTIFKMKGVLSPKKFDERHRQFSDVVLTVDDEDFYVLRKFLASRSSFFNAMFFSHFEEANHEEIELTGVDARDFQNFLETIHGEATITDSSVEGILHLADFYISPFALKECEKFFLRDSKMTPEKKYQLSKKYRLEELMEKCISEMEDVAFIGTQMEDKDTCGVTIRKLGARLVVLNQQLQEKCPSKTDAIDGASVEREAEDERPSALQQFGSRMMALYQKLKSRVPGEAEQVAADL